ncbi:MAG TPA: ABC transporter ATP-binding protein [Candidatus Rubrimentiphilum sp.]|nr:ABC transporter ATP-binding protein [Candidatus Rubrimentiphilum sp.]
MAIAARDLKKSYSLKGSRRAALDGVSLSVADGETLVILGPSGAGKTTLLRVIAGLESADAGSIVIDDRDATNLPAERRAVAIVFDQDALFPHLSVAENLAFAMHLQRREKNAIAERVAQTAHGLGITAHLKKKPAALSAGERQRASLARAVLSDPRVLLLDEPLAHLEPALRAQVRRSFAEFSKAFGGAAIHVTHDHTDALSAGDRLAILIEGKIVQCDKPQRVYDYPATTAVAKFFGSPPMNLLENGAETIGIRPEHVALNNGGTLAGRVRTVESTGADTFVSVATSMGELLARVAASAAPRVGDDVAVSLPEAHVRRFDGQAGVLHQ